MIIVQGYSQKIDDQFTLKVTTGGRDNMEVFSRLLELNTTVHGDHAAKYFEWLFLEHPNKDEMLWIYLETNNSRKIVSGIALFPLEWKIGNIAISICEMGFVGTLEPYRGRGFISKLNEIFEKAMTERNYVFSLIRGIPYYYRRLGYEFVFPLDDRIILSRNKIPNDQKNNLIIRQATHHDLNLIQKLYDDFYEQFYIFNIFDKEGYFSRFCNNHYNSHTLSTYILEEKREAVAYFSLGKSYDNMAYTIKVPHLTYQQMIKVLQFVKNLPENENASDIQLHVRHDVEFGKFIFNLGGIPLNRYGWQLKIPNLKLFFQLIRPILEQRIKNSIYQGLSTTLIISNYHENIELKFINGVITEIEQYRGYPDLELCDLRIPGSLLFKLILSDKSFNEINVIFDDASVKDSSKLLIEVLFPRKKSYPDTYY